MACTDGIYVDGRRIRNRDCSGPRSARAVLLNPECSRRRFGNGRGGILRQGLGFDPAMWPSSPTSAQGDHSTLRGIETRGGSGARQAHGGRRRRAGRRRGTQRRRSAGRGMAEHCPGRVIFFARDADHPILAAHRQRGERAIFVRDGQIVFAEGEREEVLMALEHVPLTHGGRIGFQVENVLAACAAVWSLKCRLKTIRAGLVFIQRRCQQVPGRFNVFRAGEATVIVDYAHNPRR